MLARLLLLLSLCGHSFAKKPPDVKCLVVHLKYVSCTWNKEGTPQVNYTFTSRFHNKEVQSECPTYLSSNNMNIGCNRPYKEPERFYTFSTTLIDGNNSFVQEHFLKSDVLLNPPTNVTVLNGSDSNLWFYWNQTSQRCVASEVRYRTNNKKWKSYTVSLGRQSYCINLPSSSSQYELQVRSKVGGACGESIYWSNWSEPVVWGSNNNPNQMNGSMSVWTPVLYVVGAITLIVLVMMLLHHERFRVILIPVVPKPSLISHDIEDWSQLSKGLKESFKANYNEPACSVRECCQDSQTDSESSSAFTSSVNTNQTDCSVSIPENKPEDLSTPLSPSASTVSSEEEKWQV